jgi:hypothetical protein
MSLNDEEITQVGQALSDGLLIYCLEELFAAAEVAQPTGKKKIRP